MNNRTSSAVGRTGQRGSILIFAAIGLSVAVAMLALVDIGFLYYYKREYQKAADLAALAGAKQLRVSCSAAQTAATDYANRNLVDHVHNAPTTVCGVWSPSTTTTFTVSALSSEQNAVRTTITGTVPRFLPFVPSTTIGAIAIAALGDPVATFSVGSRLLNVSGSSLLGGTLKGLGLDLSTTDLVAYDGLANVKITPAGLLEQLGIPIATNVTVGDFNALLAAEQVSVGDILDAVATLSGTSSLLSTNVTLLNALETKLGLATLPDVTIGSTSTARGLFAQIVAPDKELGSALNVGVSALDIIEAAIGVAADGHAVSIPSLSLNLAGIATVTAQAGIVEPPSIAIGGLGPDGICSDGESCPKAYTAQVRTFIHVQTSDALLGALLSPLLKLDLPIVLDVVSGKGTLKKLCTTDLRDGAGNDRAKIDVDSAIAKICVGQISASNLFSETDACDSYLSSMELVNVANILKVNNKLNIAALSSTGTVTLARGETQTTGNDLQIGTTVSSIVAQLVDLLFGGTPPSTSPSGGDTSSVATQLWNDTASLCTANTTSCHSTRLTAVNNKIQSASSSSGLISGLLNGLADLLNAVLGLLVGNGCTSGYGLLGIGPVADSYCVAMINDTLSKSSQNSSGSGTVSNTVVILTGLLKPVLDALGTAVLTPLLQDALGLHLGETDVALTALDCAGSPKLVE